MNKIRRERFSFSFSLGLLRKTAIITPSTQVPQQVTTVDQPQCP